MSILITGGAGYIGSATVEALRQRGDAIVVFDNLCSGHRAALDPSVPFVQGDLADIALIRRVIEEYDVKQVIHFAAFISVPESVANPAIYYRNNFINALNLLEALSARPGAQVVFSSTAAVYGEPQGTPIDEAHPKQPGNPYGEAKLMVEQALRAFDGAYGMRHVALRYFNACGAMPGRGEDHHPENHLIPLILQVALGQREQITVYGDDYPTPDGTCVRDYVHILDLAQAHLRALDYLAGGGASVQLNLGNGMGYSVRQVIDVARRVTGHPIPERRAERRAGDPSELVASSARARAVLGWQPQFPDLEAIIASAWEWHRNFPQGYGSDRR